VETESHLVIPEGRIKFVDVYMRYREHLDFALLNLSFEVEPKAKIGVVGRTGAGKTSLIQALFRLIESETGAILIDGTDISTVGLHEIRQQISIIP
jgi:ABC-type multidrug transport system fused ATPase/permease subunit